MYCIQSGALFDIFRTNRLHQKHYEEVEHDIPYIEHVSSTNGHSKCLTQDFNKRTANNCGIKSMVL